MLGTGRRDESYPEDAIRESTERVVHRVVHGVGREGENRYSMAFHGENEENAHNATTDPEEDSSGGETVGDVVWARRCRHDHPNACPARRKVEEMAGRAAPHTYDRAGTQPGAGSVEHDRARAVTHARGRLERGARAEARPFA